MSSNQKNRAWIWAAGLHLGLATLRREPKLGVKRLVLPVSYWRTAEFAYAWRQLSLPRGARVLDVGSPKDLALIFARHRGCQVTAIDILPEAITLSRRYAAAQQLDGFGPGLVRSEVQDGRDLPYPDDTFDAAFSISVLEHVPDHGDTLAIQELVRVVKPDGLVVVTTPFDDRYRETFVQHDVYEREQKASEPVFFERHYDAATLAKRLIEPSGATLVDLEHWGEGRVRTERILHRLDKFGMLLSPLEPALSLAFLKRLDRGTGRPMAAFFTLKKPARSGPSA
jgi:SAM-dependent methyltransferase